MLKHMYTMSLNLSASQNMYQLISHLLLQTIKNEVITFIDHMSVL